MTIPKIGLVGAIAIFTLGAASLPNHPPMRTGREKKTETVVVAGGCFWGVQGVFDAVKGVSSAISGYARREQSQRALRDCKLRHNGTCRIRPSHLRSVASFLRPVVENLFLGRMTQPS